MINWKVRIKNPYFWIALGGVILAAMGVSPEMLTSWEALGNAFIGLISNPYMIGCVVIAVLGVVNDPTTNGISDSTNALTYTKPKKD